MEAATTVAELLEVVRQLQQQIGELTQRVKDLETENQALREENARLREENTRLKKRINDLERQGKKYTAPHSREALKADPQRPGRKPGQGTFTYRQVPESITEEITVSVPNRCPACDFLGELQLSHFEKASITELPAGMRGQVTVYNVPVMICPQCGQKVRGEHPDLAAGQCGATAHRIGPRLAAVVQTLHHELGVSERKIPRLLAMTVGLSLTQGAINQAAQRLAQDGGLLAEEVLALEERLRGAAYVHHDDTGWRMNGQQAWVSAYRSEDVALFKANRRHTAAELYAVLKDSFAGTLICDRFVTYDAQQFAEVPQQKCLSHVIRNIADVAEQVQGRAGRALAYVLKLKAAFQEAITVHRDFVEGRCHERHFRIRADRVRRLVNRLLKRTDLRTKESERLRAGLWKQHQRGRLLLFLEKPSLPPTNNAAERQLRSVVLARKVSQCSKNERGATTYMRIKSITETARLRGHDPVDVLMALRR